MIEAIRARAMPLIGHGENFVSSIHVDDVGTAVAAAVAVAVAVAAGTYNIVDDEPMTQSTLLEVIVSALNAPAPRHVPYAIARVAAGKAAKVLSVSQRISNRRFRAATDWAPRYLSAVEGWAAMFPTGVQAVATAS